MRIEHPEILAAIYKGCMCGDMPICPICRKECSYLYISKLDYEVVGCDECIMQEIAEDYIEE